MISHLFNKAEAKAKKRDELLQKRIASSQALLIEAAAATADAAQAITEMLKKKLEDADQKFEATSRILNDALILCDLDGLIQHANIAAENLFGFDLIGQTLTNLFVWDDGEVTAAKLFDLFRDDRLWCKSDAPVRGRNACFGDEFEIEPKIERLDWHDKSSSMLILIRDAQKYQDFGAMKSDTPPARTIFDGAINGVLMVQDKLIVAANTAIQRMFGYKTDELLERPFSSLFPSEEHDRLEPSEDPYQIIITGMHESGRPLNLVLTATEVLWNKKRAHIVSVSEVTDKRRLQELRSFKRDNGFDMIVCFDPQFRITFANSAFAKNYGFESRVELLNQDIRKIIDPNEREQLLDIVGRLKRENPSCRVQLRKYSENENKPRYMDWIWHVVCDVDGNPIEYQRTGRDISEIIDNINTIGYL